MFDEAIFIENFVKYYQDNSDYAYDETSMLYDDYIEEVVSSNSQEINEFIINKYDNPTNVDINSNIEDRVAEILYDRFYNQAEDALVNQYESDADTDETINT
jgi:capsule polysaccharide export protein KpsE/RkpR